MNQNVLQVHEEIYLNDEHEQHRYDHSLIQDEDKDVAINLNEI